MSTAMVRFDGVSKRFRLGKTHESLGDLVSAGIKRMFRRNRQPTTDSTFWAIKDLGFHVAAGEAMGIIGPNGAGKSTALKLLSGILQPDGGKITLVGRLAALIEVGAGFHGDLSGYENIFLNGSILGMSRREIRSKLDAIVEFAGLERFLDMPVKRYSSGMYARLGFSIAAHVAPDVLLVDEVLSVGDAVFRLRCIERMHELVRGGTSLIFVTHNLQEMQSICSKAIVLDAGRDVFSGAARDAVGHYLRAMSRAHAPRPTDLSAAEPSGTQAAELTSLRFLDAAGEDVVWARSRDALRAELTLKLNQPVRRLVVELNMRATSHENLLSVNSGRDGITFDLEEGLHRVTLSLPAMPVCGGQYFWNVRAWDADRGTTLLDSSFSFPLVLDDGGRATGILAIDHQWTINGKTPLGAVRTSRVAGAQPERVGEASHERLYLR